MSILSKDTILQHILPLLPVAKRGKKLTQEQQVGLVQAIFYRLKTGCQWRQLPVERFFCRYYSPHSVFYHFNQWSKHKVWQKVWISLLSQYRKKLDMSSVQLPAMCQHRIDGTHSRCYKVRQQAAYQARKADTTTNLLFLSDNQGILLTVSEPISGQHHDLFDIEKHFEHLLELLGQAGIASEGLFLNADDGYRRDRVLTVKNCESYVKENKLLPISPSMRTQKAGRTEKSILTRSFTKGAPKLNEPFRSLMV